jgi:hypothetical protein
MADSVEDKGFLTERLEEDRQRMAIQVSELKKDYNVTNRMRASVQRYPWPWIMGAVLTVFLFSRLPARRKEVYLRSEPFQLGPLREVHPPPEEKNGSRAAHKIWFLVKPIISAYVGRQIYSRVKRPSKRAPLTGGRVSTANIIKMLLSKKSRPKLQDTFFEDLLSHSFRG